MTALCGSLKMSDARCGPNLCRGGAQRTMMPRRVKISLTPAVPPRRGSFSVGVHPLRYRFCKALIPKATGPGKDPSPDQGEGNSKEGLLDAEEDELRKGLLEFAIKIGGVGTIAVVLGFFLDIDPFANIHWSIPDITIGMWCVAPLLIYNSFVMLWNGGQTKNIGNLIIERIDSSASESEQQPVATLGPVKERSEMETLMSALLQYQQQAAIDNPSRELSPLVEGVIIVLVSLSAEMFYRAILLTVSGSWIRDRLYEGGAEDLLWGTGVPTDEAGLWFATFLFASFGVRGLIVRWQAVASFKSSMSEKFRKFPGGAVSGAAAKALRRASEVTKVATVIDAVDSVMNEASVAHT
ncbi:unnamed protein product [Ostreobium quekettii]|uniref:Uncharacterized protein n=1 Tax=Ostreobium quekettii TaxID=121088 RepID=A0A8S1IQV7_9CHLO|nr:unnamed protein product [Ostreobium quekettii]